MFEPQPGERIRVHLRTPVKYPETRVNGLNYSAGEYYAVHGPYRGRDEYGIHLGDDQWFATIPHDMVGWIEKECDQ